MTEQTKDIMDLVVRHPHIAAEVIGGYDDDGELRRETLDAFLYQVAQEELEIARKNDRLAHHLHDGNDYVVIRGDYDPYDEPHITFYVRCGGCGARGPVSHHSPYNAITAWNTMVNSGLNTLTKEGNDA